MYRYSIILPVRNGGSYFQECVRSILDQSLRGFNLHVLDNNSTDGSVEWLKSLQHPRVLLETSERSLSMEESWARVLSVRKNPFITLIGHDDVLDPEYLATMDDLIRRFPNAGIYQAHFRFIDARGLLIRQCKKMDSVQSAPEFLTSFLQDNIDVMGTGFMMRGPDYDKAGGLPPYPNLLFSDFALWITLTRPSYKATASRECFSFRRHLSTTTTSADSKMQEAFFLFLDFLAGLRNQDAALAGVLDQYGDRYLGLMCRGLSHRLLRTPMNNRRGVTVAAFLQECQAKAKEIAPHSAFHPESTFSIRLARWIDSNPVSREAFLLFKRVYSKPFYT